MNSSKFHRTVALLTALIFCFPLTTGSFAQSPVLIHANSSLMPHGSALIAIPDFIGKIEFSKPGTGARIIHIQTAHGSYEAGKNIAEILRFLDRNYGYKTLFVEGAYGDLHPEVLRFFPDDMNKTLRVADELLKRGYLEGEELYLAGTPDARVFGIEDERLYKENESAFIEVVRQRNLAQKYLRQMDEGISRIASQYLDKNVRDFLNAFRDHELEKTSLESWTQTLYDAAKRLGWDLKDPGYQFELPMLVRLYNIQDMTRDFDPAKFETEKRKFLEEIGGQGLGVRGQERENEFVIPAEAGIQERKTGSSITLKGRSTVTFGDDSAKPSSLLSHLSRFFSDHASLPAGSQAGTDPLSAVESWSIVAEMVRSLPKDFPYDSYPMVKKYIGQLLLQKELMGAALMEETVKLREKILEAFAKTDAEREASALMKDYFLLRKLFELKLTRAEYENLGSRGQVQGARENAPSPSPLPQGEDNGEGSQSLVPSTVPLPKNSVLSPQSSELGSQLLTTYQLPQQSSPVGLTTNSSSMFPSEIAHRFEAVNQSGRVRNVQFTHLEALDALYAKAMEFYRLAGERDTVMLQKLDDSMKAQGLDKAVVITGGFHADAFKEHFTSANDAYALLTPRISSVNDKAAEIYTKAIFRQAESSGKTAKSTLKQRPGAQILVEDPAARTRVRSELRMHLGSLMTAQMTQRDFLKALAFTAANAALNHSASAQTLSNTAKPALPADEAQAAREFIATLKDRKAPIAKKIEAALGLADAHEKYSLLTAGLPESSYTGLIDSAIDEIIQKLGKDPALIDTNIATGLGELHKKRLVSKQTQKKFYALMLETVQTRDVGDVVGEQIGSIIMARIFTESDFFLLNASFQAMQPEGDFRAADASKRLLPSLNHFYPATSSSLQIKEVVRSSLRPGKPLERVFRKVLIGIKPFSIEPLVTIATPETAEVIYAYLSSDVGESHIFAKKYAISEADVLKFVSSAISALAQIGSKLEVGDKQKVTKMLEKLRFKEESLNRAVQDALKSLADEKNVGASSRSEARDQLSAIRGQESGVDSEATDNRPWVINQERIQSELPRISLFTGGIVPLGLMDFPSPFPLPQGEGFLAQTGISVRTLDASRINTGALSSPEHLRALLGVKVLPNSAFLLGPKSLETGFLAAAQYLFGSAPMAVIVRDQKDLAVVQEFNAGLDPDQQILAVFENDIGNVRGLLKQKSKKDRLDLEALLLAGETLADQPSDIATQRVTLFMLQNLRGRVGPGLATIMDRMAAAFQVSRSA